MKIRSITCFANPGWPVRGERLSQAGALTSAGRAAFAAAGYEVQTARLATVPFPKLLPSLETSNVVCLATELVRLAKDLGIDYVSIGPALPDFPDSYPVIPEVLAVAENVFASGLITTADGGLSLPAIRACARVIRQAAGLSADGFANLRFAALANVPAGAPFFPAAYHDDDSPAFSLAIEAADLAVEAFKIAASLDEAQHRLVESIEQHARALTSVAQELALQYKLSFNGIDFTLAPFPDEAISLGSAIEYLGVPAVGLHGSLAAAAILTDSLDRANYLKVGFNGLMMPVLEDATLAARAEDGTLSVKDLLLYSTVCGTGLDTVPLPGDTPLGSLEAVLLDLAALSLRLDKPLTARLMPIPGKQAGDPTGFDFSYFANSKVLAFQAKPLWGVLAGDETFTLQRRRSRFK
jgi:uncharacterized protein